MLTIRTENLKHHKERRQLFSSSDHADVSLPLLRSALPQQHGAGSSSSAAAADPGGHMHQAQQQMVPSFLQSQSQLQMSAPQDTYHSSRAVALRNVETTIVELGTIFNKVIN